MITGVQILNHNVSLVSETGTAVILQTSGQGYAVEGAVNARELGYEPYTAESDCVFFVNEEEGRIMQPGDTYHLRSFLMTHRAIQKHHK